MDPDEYCRERVAKSGSDLRYCLRLLTPALRRGVIALYAYRHELDLAVRVTSEPGVARIRLAWWRGELALVYTGKPSHPAALALAMRVRDLPLTRGPLALAIDGLESELDRKGHRDLASLEEWCAAVAGGIAVAVAIWLGCNDASTLARVRELGIAIELTRTLRDVGDDARRGRVRLPLDRLAAFGIDPEEVLALRPAPRFAGLMATLAAHARERYAHGDIGITGTARRRLAPLLALAALHRTLLDELERDEFRVLERHVALTPVRRLWIATRALHAASR